MRGRFPESQPPIEWHPDPQVYAERSKRRQATENLEQELPRGWPARVEGPWVWDGNDIAMENGGPGESHWVTKLQAENIADLEAATQRFKRTGKPQVSCIEYTVLMPIQVLRGCSKRLHTDTGLIVLRGLDPDKYSEADNMIMYAGLTSHIGDRRGIQIQSSKEALVHIKDTGTEVAEFPLASHTNEAQPFHSDLGDILCLYVLQTAAEGGESHVASTGRIYNEIAATRPDIIHTLAEPWTFDTPGSVPNHFIRPILHHKDGRVIINFARRLFTGYGRDKRSAELPPISEAQAEALDVIEFTAHRFKTSMKLQKGDVQLQNNFATIHGRNGFVDKTDRKSSGRHMLRLWVRDEQYAWRVPEALETEWARVYDKVEPKEEEWHSEPSYASATDSETSCA
ncbi:Clavaminate synthase-like protein [Pseudovirgaria hyperparasitica]|uniref:Clavaminate synthase-like protein n=1 Tax=Pseudovirgaria hyperparasitica TaxID=470096 RepID=A0A6A6W3Q3_9PEZI|nr:Clavaminate synthase-like protein [Pseudovirgaria hyperparasitica]KAF2757568.1 Clavaminate synthase-like protein [Pseudovirgaria hyperparasitica]